MFCRLGGCWLAPGGGKFLSLFGVWFGREVVASFCFQVKISTAHTSCVWFWELMKQSGAFSAGWPVGGVLQSSKCVCVQALFDGLFCFVACCWVSRAAQVLLFYGLPLVSKAFLLVAAY